MKNKFSLSFALVFILLSATLVSAQNAAPAAQDKAATTRIVQLLEASGHGYSKAKEGVWVVKFKGSQMPDIAVVTLHVEGMLIFAASVAEKAYFKPAPELLQKLLGLNDHFDRVKVGIDKEGDLFVRIDLSLRIVDQKEFNANLEQISAAADETYAAIKPFLLAPKK